MQKSQCCSHQSAGRL